MTNPCWSPELTLSFSQSVVFAVQVDLRYFTDICFLVSGCWFGTSKMTQLQPKYPHRIDIYNVIVLLLAHFLFNYFKTNYLQFLFHTDPNQGRHGNFVGVEQQRQHRKLNCSIWLFHPRWIICLLN